MFCRTIEFVESMKWFLGLCVVIRFIAGIGSAMLVVAATSILMKGTSYSKSTVMVSISKETRCYTVCRAEKA